MSDGDPGSNALTEKLQGLADEAAARIAAADADAHEAQVAFAAGKFDEFIRAKLTAAQKRVSDEYERVVGSRAAGGDGEAGG